MYLTADEPTSAACEAVVPVVRQPAARTGKAIAGRSLWEENERADVMALSFDVP
jgi:hypothetical protein